MYYFRIIFILTVHQLSTIASDRAICGFEPWLDTECMRLTECAGVVSYIKRLYTTNPVVHRYFLGQPLLNMTCGFDGYEPMICCSTQNRSPKNLVDNQVVEQARQSSSGCGNILWTRNLTPDGEPTELAEFPWLALLEYDLPTGMKFGCGGVLVSDRYVLTAAHCLTSSLARVRLGEYNVNTAEDCMYKGTAPGFSRYCNNNTISVGYDKYVVHPGYNYYAVPFDARPNDIALLRLRYPVPITDYIRPVCLPSDDLAKNEVKFLSAGWGASLQRRFLQSNVKRNSRLVLVGNNLCEGAYGMFMSGDFICTQSKSSKSACIGDSGGPLMTFDRQSRMTVVGIMTPASTNVCQYAGIPGIYVDVRKHKNWILANMK